MRRTSLPKSNCAAILVAAAASSFLGYSHADASSYAWTLNANGSWPDATNWSPNLPVGGTVVGDTADFSTLDLTGDLTVSLVTGQTIGTVIFGDTSPSNNWIIGTGGTLTLDSGVANGATVTVNNGTVTFNAPIVNAQGFVKNGPGTLILTAAAGAGLPNSNTNVTINAGTLSVTNLNQLANTANGDNFIIINGGALLLPTGQGEPNTTRHFVLGPTSGVGYGTIDVSTGSLTEGRVPITNNGTGTGGLVKVGAGGMNLNATSTYSGSTSILAGTLSTAALFDGGLPSGIGQSASDASNLLIDGGGFIYSGPNTSSNRLFTIGGTNGVGTITATGTGTLTLSNTGAVAFGGPLSSRTLVLSGENTGNNLFAPTLSDNGAAPTSLQKEGGGTWVLTGTSNFTGGTTVNGGTLATTGNLTGNGAITINGGYFQIGNGGTTGSVGSSVVNANGGQLVFNRSDDITFNNSITGGNGVLLVANDTVTLGGSYSYTGDTTINAGTLNVTGNLAGTGNININTGVLRVTGSTRSDGNISVNNNTILTGAGGSVGNINLNGGGIIQPGLSPADGSVGSFTASNLNVGGGSILRLDEITPANGDRINVTNQATFNGGTITLPEIPAGGTGSPMVYTLVSSPNNIQYNSVPLLAVPEGTRSDFSLDTTTDPTKLFLDVTGASKTLFWTGANGSTWDIVGIPDNSATGTQNWTDNTIAEKFYNLDTVNFTDTTNSGPVSTYAVTLDLQASPSAVTFNNSAGNYTISGSGAITGATGVTLNGSGKVFFAVNNTYGGTTTINAGTLYLGNGGSVGSLGSGNVVVNTPGVLTFNRNDQFTVASNITGAGTVRNEGSTVVLTGSSTFGAAVIAAGTIQIGDGGTIGTIGATPVSGAGTLAFNRNDTLTVASPISGSVTVYQNGGGTAILTGNNNYSGATTINNGTLQVGSGGTTGSLGTGTVQNNSTLVFNRSDPITVADGISGGGAIRYVGGNTLTLSGSNSYNGQFTVANGTLLVGSTTAIPNNSSVGLGSSTGNTAGVFNLNGFNVTLNNLSTTGTGANVITNSAATTATLTTTGNGAVAAVLKDGGVSSGTLAFTVAGGSIALTASNSYTGGTTINNGGTLQIGNANALGSGSVNDNGNLVINGTMSLATVIMGSGQINKQGNNIATLTANNLYSGATNLQGGTLVFSTLSNLGTSNNIVFDGGALRYDTTAGNLDLSNARTITINGNGGTIDTNGNNVTFTIGIGNGGGGGFTKAGAGTLTFSGSNTYTGATGVTRRNARARSGCDARQSLGPAQRWRRDVCRHLRPHHQQSYRRRIQCHRQQRQREHRHRQFRTHPHGQRQLCGRRTSREQLQHHRQFPRRWKSHHRRVRRTDGGRQSSQRQQPQHRNVQPEPQRPQLIHRQLRFRRDDRNRRDEHRRTS